MNAVQKWEMAGVPAAIVFAAVYKMGWLSALGVTAEQLPDLMIITFVVLAFVRAGLDYFKGDDRT